jgi:GNAT superfamily N-acetyltransferase
METERWIRDAIRDAAEDAADDSASSTFGYIFREESVGIAVRGATPEDAPELAAIGLQAFHHAHAALLHPTDLIGDVVEHFATSRFREDLFDADKRSLVAVWQGTTVGFAQLRLGLPMIPIEASRPLGIDGIYVAPDWAGYGVGSALIRASLALASDVGSDVLWVRTHARNRGACSFFRRWHFSTVGRTSVRLAGGSAEPFLILSRSIEPLS